MNTCSICRHPQRSEIDRALLSFSPSLREIAQTFGLADHTCLHRHLSKCLSEEVALVRREEAERTFTTIQEITGVLTGVMRGRMTDLFNEHGRFDIEDIKERGLGHLLKTVTIEQKREPRTNGNGKKKRKPAPIDIIRVEAYSRVEAAKALGGMWVKLKLNEDANRRTDAQRRVAEQNLNDYMSAGLSFDDALVEVERDLPGARSLLNGR
jgi:hypothetical protein